MALAKREAELSKLLATTKRALIADASVPHQIRKDAANETIRKLSVDPHAMVQLKRLLAGRDGAAAERDLARRASQLTPATIRWPTGFTAADFGALLAGHASAAVANVKATDRSAAHVDEQRTHAAIVEVGGDLVAAVAGVAGQVTALSQARPGQSVALLTGRVCRVEDVTWRQAGVQVALAEYAVDEDGQVPFVRRAMYVELAARVLQAVQAHGPTVIVLSGQSTAGKTRLMLEVLRDVCPAAYFVAPRTPTDARTVVSPDWHFAADDLTGAIVVWLDDVERFIGSDGLTAADVEQLRDSGRPILFACTRGGRGQFSTESADRGSELYGFLSLAAHRLFLEGRLRGEVAALQEVADTFGEAVAERAEIDGLGAVLVARDRLVDRFQLGTSSGPCAAVGDGGEGRALVHGLRAWRAAGHVAPVPDQVAHELWVRSRARCGRRAPAGEQEWRSAVAWATCEEVPGHPLAWSTADAEWDHSDLLPTATSRDVLDAHRTYGDLIDRAAGEDARAIFAVALAAHVACGTAAESTGEVEAVAEIALEWYRRAGNAAGPQGRAVTLLNTAQLQHQLGHVEAARAALVKAIDADPENAEAAGLYADVLHSLGEMQDARENYERVIELNPGNAANLGNYAVLLKQLGECPWPEADAMFRRALTVDPDRPVVLENYAIMLAQAGDLEAALKAYERAISQPAPRDNAVANAVGASLALGEVRRARELVALLGPEVRPSLRLETLFYRYACVALMNDELLAELTGLLADGVRSPGWDFSFTITRAIQDGHPCVDMLKRLAAVIADRAPFEALDPPSAQT